MNYKKIETFNIYKVHILKFYYLMFDVGKKLYV